ncbi:MAG: FkbM family methyltransferase [Acidobacteriota bacterium]|nr:FkbM family methyltransferase [Acidobacteriota bacterium]
MSGLKKFIYNPGVLRVLRALKLTDLLRSLHYKMATQSGGIYRSNLYGVKSAFRVTNPAKLVQVEFNLMLEDEILRLVLPCLHSGDVFLDVGANIGIFTILSALVVGEKGKVMAFEPETHNFEMLERNISVNSLKNVAAFKAALGEENSKGQLFVDRPAASLMPSEIAPKEGESVESVEIVNGDDFRRTHGLPYPRVVKIDVEGFEYVVLRGLRETLSNPATELVVCEVHPYLLPKGTTQAMITEFMAALGFDDISEMQRRDEIQMIARRRPSTHAAA